MVDARYVQSLTDFIRNPKQVVDQHDGKRSPVGLTVNGKVRAILVDPETFEEMFGARERERFIAALQEGLADADAGRVQGIERVIRELKAKHGV